MNNYKYVIIFFFLLFFQCKENPKNPTERAEGKYISKETYQVVAWGEAPETVKNLVQARNMAKEAAILVAQNHIRKQFDLKPTQIKQCIEIWFILSSMRAYTCKAYGAKP